MTTALLWMLATASAQDADADTIPDAIEDRNNDGNLDNDDFDGDGTPDYLDTDDDNDGVPTLYERRFSGPGDTWHLNVDSDHDGIDDGTEWINWLQSDRLDGFYNMTNPSNPWWIQSSLQTGTGFDDPWDRDADGIPNFLDVDDDGDGVSTFVEGADDRAEICPHFGSDILDPGDGVPNYLDRDSDDDTLLDWQETQDGNLPGLDSDQDGISDYLDCSASGPDGDSDKDGLTNRQEHDLGTDPWRPDTDNDGMVDSAEVEWRQPSPAQPIVPFAQDTDGDGTPDWNDTDDDGDGVLTLDELAPRCASGTPTWQYHPQDTNPHAVNGDWTFWCDDGTNNWSEAELANTDAHRANRQLPRHPDNVLDYLDVDDDGDGRSTKREFAGTWCVADGAPPSPGRDANDPDAWLCADLSDPGVPDVDGDDIVDHLDMDDADGPLADWDGDGLSNQQEHDVGTDWRVIDSDGDGRSDADEIGDIDDPTDTDGDGIIDALDTDDDGDGIPTIDEGEQDELDDEPLPGDEEGGADDEDLPPIAKGSTCAIAPAPSSAWLLLGLLAARRRRSS